ncbi:MAG: PLP-dependent cysteine synthase family protein [Nitrospirae bacterium]|nr:PLP-dependent cysteine synthase family protein [Nitrospirota bacterium]
MLYKSILDAIGNTPIVEIGRMNPNPAVKIYAKLEGFNPTGSLKDRIAKFMVERAEAAGILTPDKVLLEATSGNTGISLAMFARLRGYRFVAVLPESMSVERREILAAFGTEVVLSPGEEGTNGAIKVAQKMLAENPQQYVMLDQYGNPDNPLAHYETTAVEILRDVPEPIDYFVAGLGTGGTLMGAGRRLKEQNPKTQIIAVQPYPKSGLQGLRSLLEGYTPPILDLNKLDGNEFVKDEDAFRTVKELAEKEGIFGGISSGAVMFRVLKLARKIPSGVIVTLLPDAGWKYLSERLWTDDVKTISDRIQGPLW